MSGFLIGKCNVKEIDRPFVMDIALKRLKFSMAEVLDLSLRRQMIKILPDLE